MGSECVFSDWSQELFLTREKLLVRFVCVQTFPCYMLKKFPVTSKVVKITSALRILFLLLLSWFVLVLCVVLRGLEGLWKGWIFCYIYTLAINAIMLKVSDSF